MFQVIEDEDLVAILKDVSGESFQSEDQSTQVRGSNTGSDYDCDKVTSRLRHHKDTDPLDLDTDCVSTNSKKQRKYTTADVVSEAIQRIDSVSGSRKSGSISGGSILSNGCDTKFQSTNIKHSSEVKSSSKSQRQRHASSKKSRKSSSSNKSTTSGFGTGSSSATSGSTSGFSPILPNVPEMDLYLNSAASNVSPDSGIQSEGTTGINNSSPLHLQTSGSSTSGGGLPVSSASSGSSELTFSTQSFQFSPGGTGSSSTIYQWPQNGYYQAAASDWTTSATSTIYASGTTIPGAPLMAVVTPLPHAPVEDVPTAILTSSASSMPFNR